MACLSNKEYFRKLSGLLANPIGKFVDKKNRKKFPTGMGWQIHSSWNWYRQQIGRTRPKLWKKWVQKQAA